MERYPVTAEMWAGNVQHLHRDLVYSQRYISWKVRMQKNYKFGEITDTKICLSHIMPQRASVRTDALFLLVCVLQAFMAAA